MILAALSSQGKHCWQVVLFVEHSETMCAAKREFKCKNDPQKFCFVCGNYIFTTPVNFTSSLQTAYRLYFKTDPKNLDKTTFKWLTSAIY